jgi:Ras family protein
VIIGNKSDLNLQRQVKEGEGRKLAKELGCAFVETSARHNENISKLEPIFLYLVVGEFSRNPRNSSTKFL